MAHEHAPSAPGLLRRIFGAIGRLFTWIRVTVLNILFLVLLIAVILALAPTPTVPLPAEFAVHLNPTGVLVDEKTPIDPMDLILRGAEVEQDETLVRDLIRTIDGAARDPRVTGLVLDLQDLVGGGISKLEEVGAALTRFKASGKPIVATGEMLTQEQYYLASYADHIYLHHMGMVLLTGYENYRHYFRETLEKLGVNVHVFRAGKYKDFIEPFTRDSMSDESRQHISQWLNQLWSVYTSRIETLRGLPSGAINDFINHMHEQLHEVNGDSAQLALQSGLVDSVLTRQEIQAALIKQFGPSTIGEGYNGIGYDAYLNDLHRRAETSANKIGLIVARGAIMDGQQPDGSIGSETFVEQIQQVRADPNIRALVVRIDSGGGSAFASEVIRAELEALRAEGTPVLISMGSVAASGGYWIAAGGDEIWATPTTLTGSIGVFGAVPTFEDSLKKLGITTDGLGTTDLAGAMRVDRPLSPQAETLIQQSVDHIYARFVALVSEARGMEPMEVDLIAQGRVWSADMARELGLVDHLGNLDEVIDAAAQRLDLDDYEVTLITRRLTPLEALLRQLQPRASAMVPQSLSTRWLGSELEQHLSPALEPIKVLQQMNDPRGIYARCMECVAP
ncbi:signal peptide peptidase SppA [Marinimicrobium sp. ABcell2]|uniref:signal peptide peptidase SppA n=1 Tax=Marinimicrobium sp. ABcell2 TaxID=3069751 RepID=UPI0027B2EB97|nr:signal peptide peptidase SppA [Marinimicrobium sp. ABcell2]MDQ2075265.1 signal peptide peptidase SppA [Marinimicrobium sp. ABcell2]